MDIRKVKKLIEMMEDSNISEIEIKEGEDSVRISRGGVVVPLSDLKLAEGKPIKDRLKSAAEKAFIGHVVGAPMVGTFYIAPSPSLPPFVKTGDAVREGDTLCIIE